MRAIDPVGIMTLLDAAAVQLLSLSLKSSSQFRLALRVLRRSTLEGAQLGDALRLLDALGLLSLLLFRPTCSLRCLLFWASRGGGFVPLVLPSDELPCRLGQFHQLVIDQEICHFNQLGL